MTEVAGLVLAAGAGTRFGGPKAHARGADGRPWVERIARTLRASGCASVSIVLGAGADEARPLVPPTASVVVAGDWADGMSASLAAGLRSLERSAAVAALVVLVDMPGLPASVCSRALGEHAEEASLRRATYAGRPGHPVLIGRAHWEPLRTSLSGDEGGRAYLHAAGAERIECADLFGGEDIDRP